jgi:lipoate-protein ligase A
LTFFGTQHKPLPNLELIVRMLSRFGVSATITPRKDLAVNNRKVSGSAYRITGPRSYHHCTLLIDADLPLLWRVLHPDLPGLIDVRAAHLALTRVTDPVLQTKATESVRSHVTNLREHDATLTHETLARAMIGTFTETYAANSEVVKVTSTVSIFGTACLIWNYRSRTSRAQITSRLKVSKRSTRCSR